MNAERPYIILLVMRAYHSLVRTLQGHPVDEMITPDLKRDFTHVLSGQCDLLDFLRNSGLVVFDKLGIKSKKRIPVEVLMNEYCHYTKEKRGTNATVKMTKKEFNSLLNVTSASILIMDEADKDAGKVQTFNIKTYEHTWPFLGSLNYQLGKKTLNSRQKQKFAFVCGIGLDFTMSPRAFREGERESVQWGDEPDYATNASHVQDRYQDYVENTLILTETERATELKWRTAVENSVSYKRFGSARATTSLSHQQDFSAILAGNEHGDEDEFEDMQLPFGTCMFLTRWEIYSMYRFTKFFTRIRNDGAERPVFQRKKDVTIESARGYVQHTLLTVKLRVQLRDLGYLDPSEATEWEQIKMEVCHLYQQGKKLID